MRRIALIVTVSPKFPGTVRMLLLKRIKSMFMRKRALIHGFRLTVVLDPQFNSDVLKPMNLEGIMDQDVQT